MQSGCDHYEEACLTREVMTPSVGSISFLSRITVGWLEDMGYEVDYSGADDFDSRLLGESCTCRRRMVRHVASFGPGGVLEKPEEPRRLSYEGELAATEYGLKYLEDKHQALMSSGNSRTAYGKIESEEEQTPGLYVGDKSTEVIFVEDGHVHFVHVSR